MVDRAVEGFLECLNAHDWESLGAYLADRIVRVAGQSDVSTFARSGYVDFVERSVAALSAYGKEVGQVVYSPDDRTAFAELIEFWALPGGERQDRAAVYVFNLDERGLITRLALFYLPVS
jgi:predicted ester cyclase